jgi:ComF family protein
MSEENSICLECELSLPKTMAWREKNNEIEKKFWGRLPVESASSYYYFHKGSKVQHLVHNIKYNGHQHAAVAAGKLYGKELQESNNYKNIDFIVPVPLHRRRQMKRGYNQSELLAKGISEFINAPVSVKNLIRAKKSESQTKKSAEQRIKNVKDIFTLRNPQLFEGKHLLLVDDVLTTGATLESCASALVSQLKDVRISIVTLAVASDL